MLELSEFVTDWARAIETADARRPIALNLRSKQPFQPGIGPHTEAATVKFVADELRVNSQRYGSVHCGVPYDNVPRQKCDLCFGQPPKWSWAIEVKLLRFLGDNGQPNDNILMHILSPYPAHRSAVTDCIKLAASDLAEHKAILIYGFDSDLWPLDPAIDAFEVIANSKVAIGTRCEASFSALVHPVHQCGRVFAWKLGNGREH